MKQTTKRIGGPACNCAAIEGRSATTTQSFINTNQPPTQHKPKKFGFVDWFVELVELIERKELCCCAFTSFPFIHSLNLISWR